MNDGGLAVGTEVGNNDLLIVLPDTAEMTASVKVHESIAGRVRPGQSVSVKVEAIDRVIPGRVTSIGVLAETGGWRDPNRREYTVKIDLDSNIARGMELKPTLRCEARIELGRVENAIAIPVQAVFNDGPVRFVLRVSSSGRFQRVPVMLGRTSDTDAEVLLGISAGDRVLLRDPMPGEVENPTGWEIEMLKAAGYTLDENGKPMLDLEAMRGMMMRRGMPAGGPEGMPGSGGEQGNAPQATPGPGSGPGSGQAPRTPRGDGRPGGGQQRPAGSGSGGSAGG
jgi:hypothetical protein